MFQPINPQYSLSYNAYQMVSDSIDGLTKIVDNHAHLCGFGQDDDFYVNCCFEEKTNIMKRLHLKVFQQASGVTSTDSTNQQKNLEYITQLNSLIDNINTYIPYKMTLLPMDFYHEEHGEVSKVKTGLFCSTNSVSEISAQYPHFIAVTSIHPAKKTAIEELISANAKGIRVIKWLPNSMNIDCENPKYGPFYKKVIELNMVILVHVGHEHSVDCGYLNQELGNPLKLRYPLDMGVKIVAAHCATEGTSTDYDFPLAKKKTDNFELFARLMDDEKYKTNLYADISACIAIKRVTYLNTLLDKTEWHSRLFFGSDYPVPCISFVTSTKLLWYHGLIKWNQIKTLNEIFYSNPLLYNLVVFRTLRSKKNNKFSNDIFERSIHDL
jgi:predicted TIM-barrel fold metal-dependent hydrolase